MNNAERKVIKKALRQLYNLGSPSFSVSQNRMVRKMRPRDEMELAYTIGLLEALIFDNSEEDEVEIENGK